MCACRPLAIAVLGPHLKPGEYSTVASPKRMQVTPPLLKVCLSSKGSRAGSSSAPTPSSSTGLPNWMAFSSTRSMSPPLEGLMTCSAASTNMPGERPSILYLPYCLPAFVVVMLAGCMATHEDPCCMLIYDSSIIYDSVTSAQ